MIWAFSPLDYTTYFKMKWPYLGSWATNKKSKDTLLSQTLKVEEKKVTLVFIFVAQKPRYGNFFF